MGDSIGAICDDIEDYERRCERFKEKVQYNHGSAACYSAHSTWLEELERREEIRSGRLDPCNWSKYATHKIEDLDAALDRFVKTGSLQEQPAVAQIEPKPKETKPEELTRFKLLEVD